jgi:hypothetical protein
MKVRGDYKLLGGDCKMKLRWAPGGIALLLVGACATPQYYDYDSIQFRGDNSPMVQSSQAARGDFSNLTEGESIVVAIAADGSGAISHPNNATTQVIEALLSNRNDQDDLEMIRKRCDPDGDGVWDMYCPELMNDKLRNRLNNSRSRNGVGNSKERAGLEISNIVIFDSFITLSRENTAKDRWATSAVIDRSKAKVAQEPIYLRLITMNKGNKDYRGDLEVMINVPPQVKFGAFQSISQIRDGRGAKAFVSSLPFIQLAAGAMANYPTVKTDAEIQQKTDDGKIRVTFKHIVLKPGDGVSIDYNVTYAIEGR